MKRVSINTTVASVPRMLLVLLLSLSLGACSGGEPGSAKGDGHDHDHKAATTHDDEHGHDEHANDDHADEHDQGHGDEHGHGAHAAEEFERGPNGARLLREGTFALEISIFEDGVDPQFRLYAYQNEQPLSADQVQASVQLTRLGGQVDTHNFSAGNTGDFLQGDGIVSEPHSFDVLVRASHAGQSFEWQYASYEGRTQIPEQTARAAGIRTAIAGPAEIGQSLQLYGLVRLNGDRVVQLRSPFAGLVREVRVVTGAQVSAGQTLAMVENRDSLRSFAITAPISGVLLARHTNVGDVAGDAVLFEIADLSTLWVDLQAFGESATPLRPGQSVQLVASTAPQLTAQTQVQAVLPQVDPHSQAITVRALLPNADGLWRPGMHVSALVEEERRTVPLAVARSGLQRFRDFTVVYAQFGDTYEVRMLTLGAQDASMVEVLGGLQAGTRYVSEQSFLLRADIEKSAAAHDH